MREVCEAIFAEYVDEVLKAPILPDGWQTTADKFLRKWIFPLTCRAILYKKNCYVVVRLMLDGRHNTYRGLYMDKGRAVEGRRGRWQNGRRTL